MGEVRSFFRCIPGDYLDMAGTKLFQGSRTLVKLILKLLVPATQHYKEKIKSDYPHHVIIKHCAMCQKC